LRECSITSCETPFRTTEKQTFAESQRQEAFRKAYRQNGLEVIDLSGRTTRHFSVRNTCEF
jgi:hypothetical protein